MNTNQYQAPGPYPPVRVQARNLDYARLLREDFAGQVSEFSAIAQYLHHHYTLTNVELAMLLEGISQVEMRHMEILGELIVALGGDPRYTGEGSNFWNGSYVAYLTGDICAQLRADLEGERAAIRQYEAHRRQIADPFIREIIARIIQDEECHITLLQAALDRYCLR